VCAVVPRAEEVKEPHGDRERKTEAVLVTMGELEMP
jgi:hypothetical protein